MKDIPWSSLHACAVDELEPEDAKRSSNPSSIRALRGADCSNDHTDTSTCESRHDQRSPPKPVDEKGRDGGTGEKRDRQEAAHE